MADLRRLDDLLASFVADPTAAAVITDFDGTLSPIVENPDDSRPLAPVPALLDRLAGRYGRVAVVSGRPASFLADRLLGGHAGEQGSALILSGLYGLERVQAGSVQQHPDALPWADAIADAADRAEAALPAGVYVERKGLSVTLHVRRAPEHAREVESWATAVHHQTGLALHPGRMSWELRPPVTVDKGTVVAELIADLRVACFAGDDVGDLPAFDALDRFAAGGGVAVRIAARSDESPAELLERADLVVDGPEGVAAVFHHLAR